MDPASAISTEGNAIKFVAIISKLARLLHGYFEDAKQAPEQAQKPQQEIVSIIGIVAAHA
jgi:hypothetical protein